MNSLKIKQFALGFCVVLSLFASSFAACACAHHQEKVETNNASCHQDSMNEHSGEMPMSPIDSAAFEPTDNCVCVQTAPRQFAKSEIVKIEKQAATIAPPVSISTQPIAIISTVEVVHFTKPFYLSDSFYNIKSPRAPPIL